MKIITIKEKIKFVCKVIDDVGRRGDNLYIYPSIWIQNNICQSYVWDRGFVKKGVLYADIKI